MREWLKAEDSSGLIDNKTYQSVMEQIEEAVEQGYFSMNGQRCSFRTNFDNE